MDRTEGVTPATAGVHPEAVLPDFCILIDELLAQAARKESALRPGLSTDFGRSRRPAAADILA
jgi:hypothetical protein